MKFTNFVIKKLVPTALALFCAAALAGCVNTLNKSSSGGAGSAGLTPPPKYAMEPEYTVKPADTAEPGEGIPSPAESEPAAMSLSLRIVDGAETGELVLAGESGKEVYLLSLAENSDVEIYLDGEPADASALEDGMPVELSVVGIESVENIEDGSDAPARIDGKCRVDGYSLGSEKNPGGGTYDLCGLYLQVLEDLWEVDPGLNGGTKYAAVDMSEAPGMLTDGEKSAVAWIFAHGHGLEPLLMTYEQLAEAEYLTRLDMDSEYPLYEWEDGEIFRITERALEEDEAYSLPVVKFDAEKWRSPLGAYYLIGCTAVWPELGTWSSYTVESCAIS